MIMYFVRLDVNVFDEEIRSRDLVHVDWIHS